MGTFWLGLFQSWMTAFATASTAAALPITFRCMQKNKVDPRISKFVLPIGATVNMDGTALFVTVASIFIAQMNGIDLNAGQLATVVLTSTAASIASASVPSAALVLMLIVLSAIDAPYRDVSLLWAIDWFVDRCRTTNNMLGDAYGAAVVEALSKNELNAMDEERAKRMKIWRALTPCWTRNGKQPRRMGNKTEKGRTARVRVVDRIVPLMVPQLKFQQSSLLIRKNK